MGATFKALVLEQADGKVAASFKDLTLEQLMPGEVTIAVACSTLNYKDGLAVTGAGRIARTYPMIAGIDLAGTVESSTDPAFAPGDKVLVVGCGLSESHFGGYAEKARVRSGCVVRLPGAFSLQQAMAIGTAGFTAMLSVMALEDHGLKPGAGEVLVTGAAGGVGSVAVTLLARLGHTVVASTGRPQEHDYLKGLGASSVIERAELSRAAKPMEAERWAGAIDTVGGDTLATVIATLKSHASVAACGLAGGHALPTTVFPFILRGVNLLGINSVVLPSARRQAAWDRLARDLPTATLDAMTRVIPFAQVPEAAKEILKGQVRGRTVVRIAG